MTQPLPSPSNEVAKPLVVGIGDIKTGVAPYHIQTMLGSCVAVCVYCAAARCGGMLHFMMAHVPPNLAALDIKKAKYAETGIPELIKRMQTVHGVAPEQMTAKLFGGANIIQVITTQIGQENENAALRILKGYGVKIIARKTGGERGYKLDFDLSTGKVVCQKFGDQPEEI